MSLSEAALQALRPLLAACLTGVLVRWAARAWLEEEVELRCRSTSLNCAFPAVPARTFGRALARAVPRATRAAGSCCA